MSRKRHQTNVLCFFIAMLLYVPSLAQDEKPEETAETVPAFPDTQAPAASKALEIGDAAPPLTVDQWLLGEPIAELKAGTVHVIEFWATWCGPCRASMPHVSKLQQEYGDAVRIVGVTRESADRVGSFLDGEASGNKTWRETIQYRLAIDAKGATNAAYMQAASQSGIPCAFVIGKDNRVDWIGHPASMDVPLARIVDGRWDRAAAIAEFRQARRLKELSRELNSLRRANEWDAALAMLDKVEEDFGSSAMSTKMRISMLQGAGRADEASKLQDKLVEQLWDDPSGLNELAWTIATGRGDDRNLRAAFNAAQRASELKNHEDGAILDTFARVYYEQGELEKAIEWQRKAVKYEPGHLTILKSLITYETEKVMQLDPSDPVREVELIRIEEMKPPILAIQDAGGKCAFKRGSQQVVTSIAFENTLDLDAKLERLKQHLLKLPDLEALTFSRVQRISSWNQPKQDLPPLPPNAGVTDAGLEHVYSLPHIKTLQLRGVQVGDSGLTHVGKMADLESLSIMGTGITDAGLEHLKGLTRLKTLQLWATRIDGAGLEHVAGLASLQHLDLSGAEISDAHLKHIANLSGLVALNLGRTRISDAGLVHLEGLTKLHSLNLGDTRITEAGLKHLAGMTQLSDLDLSNTKVTDKELQALKPLTQLSRLNLKNTAVGDAGLQQIAELTKLSMLIMDGTQVTDAGLEHLQGLTNLYWLTLSGTKISDAGLEHIKPLKSLRILGSDETQITRAGREKLKRSLPNLR